MSTIRPFRPSIRPPMARLTIMDDGSSDGEVVRIRQDVTIIGRTSGDIRIPHDPAIADEHLKIERFAMGSEFQWLLTDLESETGLWIRVRRIELREADEFMAGKNKFHFVAATGTAGAKSELMRKLDDGSLPGLTVYEPNVEPKHGFARIECSVSSREPFKSSPMMHLIDGEYWIGRGAECAISLPSDLFLGTKHVRINHESDRWFAETLGVTNGMWIRKPSMIVQQSCAFQLGEQRFHFACRWDDEED